jgi:cellulose synthase/poly-beta-1,6-N-acetylglucosamine synthase-like glycosyltransferase
MIVDADCDLDAGAVDRLVSIAAAEDRPVQGRNLMKAPAGAPLEIHVAEFAYLIKNLVRPRGMNRLGLPCQLMGTGMAIPWSMIRQANLAHGHIVEDLKLCLDLAQLGHAPVFCPDFGITSYFPHSSGGIESQRRRWEGGHLEMIGVALDHLARPASIRSLPALILLLDRLVPPVTLLFMMLVAWTMLSAAAAPIVGVAPLLIAIACMASFVLSTFVVWLLHGREIIPRAMIAAVPRFIVGRLANYPKFLLGRQEAQWVRTDRGD